MKRYYEYLRFFCNTPLDEKDKLAFLEDGSFTITTAKHVVSLYSAKAELIARYENAHVLENGCICVKQEEHIDVIHGDNPLPSIPFEKGAKTRVVSNAVVISMDGVETIYFVSPDDGKYRSYSFPPGVAIKEVSADGMIQTYKHVAHNEDEMTLYDQNGKPLNLPPFYRVDFLPCGSYIVHFYDMVSCSVVLDGCALYNAAHEKLLDARQSCQILQLGDKVLYQQSLIIDPKRGNIISKYNGENAVFGGLHIFTHEITGGIYSRLWVGGEMKAVMQDSCVIALYYWKDGRIYFAPQCHHSIDDDLVMHNYVSEHYRMRIREIMN